MKYLDRWMVYIKDQKPFTENIKYHFQFPDEEQTTRIIRGDKINQKVVEDLEKFSLIEFNNCTYEVWACNPHLRKGWIIHIYFYLRQIGQEVDTTNRKLKLKT